MNASRSAPSNITPSNTTPSISAPAFLDLYDALVDQNVRISEAALGFQRDELMDIEKRVPASMQNILWGIAKKQGAPDHIGLIVGQQINDEAHGMMAHLMNYTADLREALKLYERYVDVMSEYEGIEIQPTHWGCRIVYKSQFESESNISAVERSLSSLLTRANYLTGEDIHPVKVGFQHARPSYYAEYEKAFKCPVQFGQENSYIDVDNLVLDYKVHSANQYIKEIIKEHIEKFVGVLNKKDSLSYLVKSMLSERLNDGGGNSSLIADELNMSRQTLHRKLKQSGLNFRTLLESVRKEKAVEYLYSDTLTLEEISEKLGFKEPSAFYRAFKGWFKQSPGNFKKGLS